MPTSRRDAWNRPTGPECNARAAVRPGARLAVGWHRLLEAWAPEFTWLASAARAVGVVLGARMAGG